MKKTKLIVIYTLLIVFLGIFLYITCEKRIGPKKTEKEDPALNLYYKAKSLGEQGKIDEAFSVIKKSIKLNPKIGKNHILLGYLEMSYDKRWGNLKKAEEELKKALSLKLTDEDKQDALLTLGILNNRVNRFEKALGLLNEAIKLGSNSAPAYIELGNAYSQTGVYDEAKVAYSKALELSVDPREQAAARFNLGLNYSRQKLYNEAINEYKSVLEFNPAYMLPPVGDPNSSEYKPISSGNAHEKLAEIYLKQKKYDEAIIEAQESTRIDPYLSFGYYELAAAYILKGDLNAAKEVCEKLKSIDERSCGELQDIMVSPKREDILEEKFRE